MVRPSKQFKKFASSGKLKDTIKSRRKHQEAKRKVEDRLARRSHQRGAPKSHPIREDNEEGDEEDGDVEGRDIKRMGDGGRAGGVAKTVEELFGGKLDGEGVGEGSDLEDLSDEEDGDEEEDEEEEDDEEDGEDDGGVLEVDEEGMKMAMKELEKKDPDFYKYLKENDQELLDFGQEASTSEGSKRGKGKQRRTEEDEDDEEELSEDRESDEDEEDSEEEIPTGPRKTSVTMRMLRGWQEGLLKQHSLRSLRKTLLAFRAAIHTNEADASQGSGRDTKYTVDSAAVFNKLVLTALKYTPVVMAHHIPFKSLPNGRIRVSQPKKPNQALSRLLLSHVSTLIQFMKTLPANSTSSSKSAERGLLVQAIEESSKLLPWILGARKHLRAYLKTLLDLWSSGGDDVKIASFLAIRKMFIAGDDALKDLCLRNTYKSLLPTLRHTTPHTLPAINILKNTASELFNLEPARSYPQAFTFIRTLAVHLRSVVRTTTSASSKSTMANGKGKGGAKGKGAASEGNQAVAEAFRTVYNWQYIHCLDFWCLVLGSSCDVEVQRQRGGTESELQPLIYPLVQIALGVIRLLPSSRYLPLRFHILHSLIRLISRTRTYIPLSPFLLEILDSVEFRSTNPKRSTLKPLDLEYVIRAPPSYPKTRVYQETLGDELVYLLGEYHAILSDQIAFPEITIPVIVTLRRHLKKATAGSQKVQMGIKNLVEKIESTRKWVEGKRRGVGFSPKDRGEVMRWSEKIKRDETPIGAWMKVQRKVREKRRKEVEMALREERGEENGDGAGEDDDDEDMGDFDEDEDEQELEMDDEDD